MRFSTVAGERSAADADASAELPRFYTEKGTGTLLATTQSSS